jgi:DnaJ family protein C protein 28
LCRTQGFVKAIPKPGKFPAQAFATNPIDPTPSPASDETPSRPLHPWEYEYKAPENYQPPPGYRVRTSVAPGASKKKPVVAAGVKGTAGAAVVKRARLASAYERTLDYKVGVRGSASPQRDEFEQEEHDASMLGNPTMSAWGGVAEAKIQQAIRQGMLKHIKGRGKPIERDDAESNPFISRCVGSFLP